MPRAPFPAGWLDQLHQGSSDGGGGEMLRKVVEYLSRDAGYCQILRGGNLSVQLTCVRGVDVWAGVRVAACQAEN